MASLNKALLIGNLGDDPTTRYMPSGDAVTNISIATTEQWKETTWHKVSFFGKLAEIAGEYLKKGASVYIEGRIKVRKYQAKDGTDRYSTEIVADRMQMLGGKREEGGERTERPAQTEKAAARPAKTGGAFDDMDDDIPF